LRSGCAVLLSAHEAPATTIGNVAELGDIDMDQRAGMVVFVAAQRLTGHPIDMTEPADPAAHEHGMHRRGRQAELAGDLHRAETVPRPQLHDLPNDGLRGLGRAGLRSRAAIGHPGRSLVSVPTGPLASGARRHHEHLRRRRVRPALLDDELGQPQAGARGQLGISVGHEGLRSVKRYLDSSTSQPEAFVCLNDRPNSTRNNVPGHHI
jgi:hypothetical protein